jgi:SSS family solute:Na+ symporter
MAWAFEVIAGLSKTWGCLLGGLVPLAYFSRGGLVAAVSVNIIELVVRLIGLGLALAFAWGAAGGWSGLSAAEGPSFGASGALGLALALVPSFVVSPGLVQKTFGARDAGAARRAALWNGPALAAFAFVPALLGIAAAATRPGLPNPELALPVLLAEVLPPWLGAFGLAALFAAEVSTADAVLFMLSTSLGKDLYKTFLRPAASDADLLRVSRWTSVGAGLLGIVLAILLPSVVAALKGFYSLMAVALFAPVLVGLWARRPGPGHARAAIASALLAFFAGSWLWRGTEAAAFGPQALGIGVAFAVFATAWVGRPPAPRARHPALRAG